MSTNMTSNLRDLLREVADPLWAHAFLSLDDGGKIKVRYISIALFEGLNISITDDAQWIVVVDGSAHAIENNAGACEAMVRISRARFTLLLAEGASRIGISVTAIEQSFPWGTIIQSVFLHSNEYWINRALDWIASDERSVTIVESLAKRLQQNSISQTTAQQIRHKLTGICEMINVEIEQKLRLTHPGAEERNIRMHYRFQNKGYSQREIDLVVMPNRGANRGKTFAFEFKAYPTATIQSLIHLKDSFCLDENRFLFNVVWLVSIPIELKSKLKKSKLDFYEKAIDVESTYKFINKLVWP